MMKTIKKAFVYGTPSEYDLFNTQKIKEDLASTIERNDNLTNSALIFANNVAAVMKYHGFTFDQAVKIVEIATRKDN